MRVFAALELPPGVRSGIAGAFSKARALAPKAKWVAEDAFSNLVFQALRDKQIRWGQFVSYLRGRKTYGIFSINDPLPFFYFLFRSWLPQLTRKILHFVFSRVLKSGGKGIQRSKGIA